MQKEFLILFVASLGVAWVHAVTPSPGYCCPQITVALGTDEDGTYTFLAEGDGPASERCQNDCLYSKDSNKTAVYCFEAVTSEDLGEGEVQCEAIKPFSGPTAEELLKKLEKLQKDFEAQVNETKALKKEVDDIKEDDSKMETDISNMLTEVQALDGRLNNTEMRHAVCGYKNDMHFKEKKALFFERVYDEVDSNTEGSLLVDGTFTAGVAGVYFITVETMVALGRGESVEGFIELSSGNYADDKRFIFTKKHDVGGTDWARDQASASRYVTMAAGETMQIMLTPAFGSAVNDGTMDILQTTMCVSLYSASR